MAVFLPYAIAMMCGAVPLWICLKLKTELRGLKVEMNSRDELDERERAAFARIDNLEAQLAGLRHEQSEQADWVSQTESLNLNRRGQVLRLHRRGESVAGIATALRMGQGEVTLMIKVHEMGRAFPV